MNFLFSNIGGKIKVYAKVAMILGIIGSFIGAIALAADVAEGSSAFGGFIVFIFFFFPCSLACWIGSLFISGFGQLVENSDKIAENTQKQ